MLGEGPVACSLTMICTLYINKDLFSTVYFIFLLVLSIMPRALERTGGEHGEGLRFCL